MVSFAEIQNSLSAQEGRYLLRETAFPHGELKAEYISIREPNGRLVTSRIGWLIDR